jgi:hypothetical protein
MNRGTEDRDGGGRCGEPAAARARHPGVRAQARLSRGFLVGENESVDEAAPEATCRRRSSRH